MKLINMSVRLAAGLLMGTDAKTIAAFVQEVFGKLFKTGPDSLHRTEAQGSPYILRETWL